MSGRLLLPGLVALALLAAAVPARAAVTIGSDLSGEPVHVPDGCNLRGITCTVTTVGAGTAPDGLISPVNGTVTSWRAKANPGTDLRLRVLRSAGPVQGVATTMTGVGTSIPASFPAGLSPPLRTSLPIKAGDLIGLDSPGGTRVLWNSGALAAFANVWRSPPLGDGETRVATSVDTVFGVVLVQATIVPTNVISFGDLDLNKRKGVAKLEVELPNSGELEFSGARIKVAGRTAGKAVAVGAAGEIRVKIRAKGKKLRRLKSNGKVKVKPVFKFTPTNGDTSVTPRGLKLRRKPAA